MAYLVNNESEDEKKSQNLVAPGQNVSIPNTGAAPQGTQAANGAQSNVGTQSGSFTNIQKYLDANQDQAAPLANKIADQTTTLSSDALASANQAQKDFQTQLQQNIPQSSVDLSKSLAPSEDESGNPPQQRASALTPDQRQQIIQARTAQYTGPKNIESTNLLSDAYSKANQAKTLGDLSGTESGRYQLLRQYVNNPTYTTGQQRLDQSILQTNPQAQQTLQNMQGSANNLNNQINTIASNANTQVAPAQKQFSDAQNLINQNLNASAKSEMDAIAQRASEANTLEGAKYNLILQALSNPNSVSDPQLYQKFGSVPILPGSNYDQSKYNLDPSKYVVQAPLADKNTIAEGSEAADLEALQGMLQSQNPYLDYSQADSFHGNTGFNNKQFSQDLLNELTPYWQKSGQDVGTYSRNNMGLIDSYAHEDPNVVQGFPLGQNDFGQMIPKYNEAFAKLQSDNQVRKDFGLPQLDLSGLVAPASDINPIALQHSLGQLSSLLQGVNSNQNYYNPDNINNLMRGGESLKIPNTPFPIHLPMVRPVEPLLPPPHLPAKRGG